MTKPMKKAANRKQKLAETLAALSVAAALVVPAPAVLAVRVGPPVAAATVVEGASTTNVSS